MKILYTFLFALLLVVCGLTAQATETKQTIRIERLQTNLTGDVLEINFGIKVSELKVKCNGQMIIEFAVENSDRRLVLPVVVYSGNQRYRYEQRRESLSDGYYIAPYHVYKGVKSDRTYELDYKLNVPYYAWMEHASITYREYTHDCDGDRLAGGGTLLSDLNPAPVYVEPEIWKPDATLFPNLVGFLMPEVEEVKSRASMLELNIGFPVNITEVRPAFANNRHELSRADALVERLQTNDLLAINGVYIRGYASPEGRYVSNERLAKGRSEGFKQYLVRQYPDNVYVRNAATSWVAEDWEGLAKLVQNSDIPHKDEILAVALDGSMAPDSKEQVLQKIGQWSYVYKPMLDNLFPKLRRIELRVDYTVQKLDDSKAREYLYTHPEMLSLEEIYRVARYYEPGSKQYREVYEIAARQYPDDVIANNNAAAALLQEGKAAEALPYLQKIAGTTASLVNTGAYYYITEDLEKAIEYFTRAKEVGIPQGEHNLKLIMD